MVEVGRERGDRLFAAALFIAALGLRLLHLFTVRDSPLFPPLFIDPKMYDEWAAAIASGRLIGDAPFFIDPLYPYFVAAIYALAGRSAFAVALVQSLLGALVPVLLFLAARSWWSRPTPQLVGGLAALYAPAIFWGGVLMKPAPALVAASAALWFASRALSRDGAGLWVCVGACMGAVALLRGHVVFVLPLLVVWLVLDPGVRRRYRAAGAFVVGAVAVLSLALAHNLAASGEPIPTTANWGQILFLGNHPDNPSGRFYELPFVRSDPQFEQIDFKREAERRADRTLTHREVSSYWMAEALRWMRSHPLEALVRLGSKVRIYWGGYETPASLDYYLYSRHAPVLRWPLPGFGLVGPLALLGAVLAWRRGAWSRLLVVYVVGSTLAASAFFMLTRFRLAAVPALCCLAAYGGVELGRQLVAASRGRHRLQVTGSLALLAVAFAGVNLPVRATADCRTWRLAEWLGLPRELQTTANAHYNLGVTYARQAKDHAEEEALLGRAETELRLALAETGEPKFLIELGKVLARRGRDAEAIDVYRQAREASPGDWQISHVLGVLHRRSGDLAAAETAFRQALSLDPRRAVSAIQLGEVLLALGRRAEAASAFRHALGLQPDNASVREALAAAEAP